jgi:hypothetical protein
VRRENEILCIDSVSHEPAWSRTRSPGRVLAIFLTTVLALPLVASAARSATVTSLEGPAPEVAFFLSASQGYGVFVTGDHGKVTVSVLGRQGGAAYEVDGNVSQDGLRVRLGRLGRLDLAFKPSGETDRLVPPSECAGKNQLVREGTFSGTIRFRGERGYTRLRRDRVTGAVAIPRSWRCRPEQGADEAPLDLSVLRASNHRVGFFAIGGSQTNNDFRFFSAGTTETRGRMRIERWASANMRRGMFDVLSDLSAATVTPPKPFRGAAAFARNVDGSTSWSGDLSVELPGAGRVALTGPRFAAELAKPMTLAELYRLLNLPSEGE